MIRMWALQALQDVSWVQAIQTLGLALNTTLASFLLQKRVEADRVHEVRYLELQLRLSRIEKRCYGETEDSVFGVQK